MCDLELAVCIVADDLGYATERDRGICELLSARLISRASLLVNAPNSGAWFL